VLKLQQALRPAEVNRTCQSFLSFVKTSSVNICRVTVSVLRGSVILCRSQLLGQTVGWKGITDRKVMEGRRKQEGFASNIIHHTNFIEGQRSVEEECMACLWTDKYINKFVFRSHFNRCTTGGVTQTYCCTIPQSPACTKHFLVHKQIFAEPNFKDSCQRPSVVCW